MHFIRETTLSPAEWHRLSEERRSLYQRWARPLLRAWGARLHLRSASFDPLSLIQAGINPERVHGLELRAISVMGLLAGLMVAGGLSLVIPQAALLAPLLGWIGYILPFRYLHARRRARQIQILRELPDLVGLLRAFVAAGLPLEQALHLVTTHPGSLPVLGEEVATALGRYGLGQSLDETLNELAQRIGIDDVTLFIGSLLQGRLLGTGLDHILRQQEIMARLNQRNRATAEASRIGTKLLGVLAGVYLPEFILLIMIPLFSGILRRAFG